MTMKRENFGDLLAPGFREIFFMKFGEKPPQMEELFNLRTSSRQFEEDSYVSGLSNIPKKVESAPVSTDAAIQGFDTRYTHDTFSLQYKISREMNEDDLYGIMRKMPAALGRSMRNTVEIDAANIYNRAFDTTNYADGADGKALFVTDHPLVGGGTQKNRPTTFGNLNATSLEQALIDLRATTDDRGQLLHLKPIKLVVPPTLEWTALKLIGSAFDPDSANNAVNPAHNILRVVVNDYLTDTNAWFVIGDEHEVNWFWRVRPDHESDNDFQTDDALFKVRARWSRKWSLPWGVYGNEGS